MNDPMDAQLANLRRLGGDKFVTEMIDLFLQTVPERLRGVHTGWQEGNLVTVQKAAHSVKSSAGNIGAMELQTLLGDIEQLAAQRETDRLAPLVAALDATFDRARVSLQAKRGPLP